MIDPITSLAFSLFSQKGRYALLIGSGVSSSAGIYTGYEITLDLIKKIAISNNENCDENPEELYREKYKKDPDYSEVLSLLGKTRPSQIKNILQKYIEPQPDMEERNLRKPMEAHKSIARLVKEGYIKVIITTNFDRLIENAIIDVNKPPYIISTSDDIKGMEPLEHLQEADSIVIKVNGDYLDTRIKNTETELKKYDRKLTSLIKDIFEKYGLIICGWSGEYDIALRDSICSTQNRRYSTYCTYRSPIKPEMQNLANNRQAETIHIEDADSFFKEIADRVLALKNSTAIHPASKQIAIERLKRHLKDENKFDIHDLVMKETKLVDSKIKSEVSPKIIKIRNNDTINTLKELESLCNILISLYIAGIQWGKNDYKSIWKQSFERLTNYKNLSIINNFYFSLLFYPALLLLYSVGIVSIYKNEYDVLFTLLYDSDLYEKSEKKRVVKRLNPLFVIKDGNNLIDKNQNSNDFLHNRLPLSNLICNTIRTSFNEILFLDNEKYEECFDTFEYLFALINFHENNHGFPGCFCLRYCNQIRDKNDGFSTDPTPMDNLKEKVIFEKDDLPILKAGFFNKSHNTMLDVINKFDTIWMNSFKSYFI